LQSIARAGPVEYTLVAFRKAADRKQVYLFSPGKKLITRVGGSGKLVASIFLGS